MNKILFICLAIAAFGLTSMITSDVEPVTETTPLQTYVKIKIKNDCGHDVKYEYNGLHGSLSKNYYRELTIKPGHTLIIDGDDFAEITTSSDKKTFVVCK